MNIGIIGTGTIASALVRGFLTAEGTKDKLHFVLSPRNKEKVEALKTEFPDHITIAEDNQAVVDASDWVFLTIPPKFGQEVLTKLSFRPEQKVLSIMSDHPLKTVASWIGPTKKLVRMVPLPFNQMHCGPIAYYPEDPEIQELFAHLGSTLSLDEESKLSIISGLTGLMSPFYMLLSEVSDYGAQKGLSRETSLQYMADFFGALCEKAKAEPNADVKRLALEMTPGGLNEMALRSMTDKDAFAPWKEALDQIFTRLDKKDCQFCASKSEEYMK